MDKDSIDKIINGNLAFVQDFFSDGVKDRINTNTVKAFGKRFLTIALSYKQFAIAEYLVNIGVSHEVIMPEDANLVEFSTNRDIYQNAYAYAYAYAYTANSGYGDCARKIEINPNTNRAYPYQQQTRLFRAYAPLVRQGEHAQLKVLLGLDSSSELGVYQLKKNYSFLLLEAMSSQHPETFKVLLQEGGAFIHQMSSTDFYALAKVGMSEAHYERVEMLFNIRPLDVSIFDIIGSLQKEKEAIVSDCLQSIAEYKSNIEQFTTHHKQCLTGCDYQEKIARETIGLENAIGRLEKLANYDTYLQGKFQKEFFEVLQGSNGNNSHYSSGNNNQNSNDNNSHLCQIPNTEKKSERTKDLLKTQDSLKLSVIGCGLGSGIGFALVARSSRNNSRSGTSSSNNSNNSKSRCTRNNTSSMCHQFRGFTGNRGFTGTGNYLPKVFSAFRNVRNFLKP